MFGTDIVVRTSGSISVFLKTIFFKNTKLSLSFESIFRLSKNTFRHSEFRNKLRKRISEFSLFRIWSLSSFIYMQKRCWLPMGFLFGNFQYILRKTGKLRLNMSKTFIFSRGTRYVQYWYFLTFECIFFLKSMVCGKF